MGSEGTSLDDIETGNVQHTADDMVMNAILSDMNAVDEAPTYTAPPVYQAPPEPPMQPMQPMQHMPPMQPMQPMPTFDMSSMYQQATYERVEEPQQIPHPVSIKKNSWSALFDDMRDPLFVGVLVCLFSLPALHTWLAKRATWAYKIGGSLSWLGFLLLFVIVAGIFATYRQIVQVMDS